MEKSAILSSILTFYRTDKTIAERTKTRIPLSEIDHKEIGSFMKHIDGFLGIRSKAAEIGMASHTIKLFRLVPSSNNTGKHVSMDNFAISTQGQWDMERDAFLTSCGELNSMYFIVIIIIIFYYY